MLKRPCCCASWGAPDRAMVHKPKRTLLRLVGLTLYTGFMYLIIKISGKIKA